MQIKYIATIKEWRDNKYGNTYFSASIDDIENEKEYKLIMQYGDSSLGEQQVKKYLGLKGFSSELPIKFITIPNCKQREVIKHGGE